jgi:Leucine-rich repeat (LRR) protein
MDGLEKLNVSQNKLIALPSPIANLAALTDLDISYNEIREVPADFGKLKLKRLGFAGNKLKVRERKEVRLALSDARR